MKKVLKPLGPYFIFDLIASGGMAEVFRARHASSEGEGRLLAIKRILSSFANEVSFNKMFQSEMRVALRLNHPNIARLFEAGNEDGTPYLVMEYIQGKTIKEILASFALTKTYMPIQMATYVVAEAARGLHYAHTFTDPISRELQPIIHRDISPQNILVAFDGTVKVIDFGIAKAVTNLEQTQPGNIKGKVGYLSPEQISGVPLDGRSDQFALGIVLWEILTRRRAFRGETNIETMAHILKKDPPPPSTFNKDVPAELDAIVKKSLSKDKNARYATADDFERALRRFMNTTYPDFVATDIAKMLQEMYHDEIMADQQVLSEMNREYKEKHQTNKTLPKIKPLAPPINADVSLQTDTALRRKREKEKAEAEAKTRAAGGPKVVGKPGAAAGETGPTEIDENHPTLVSTPDLHAENPGPVETEMSFESLTSPNAASAADGPVEPPKPAPLPLAEPLPEPEIPSPLANPTRVSAPIPGVRPVSRKIQPTEPEESDNTETQLTGAPAAGENTSPTVTFEPSEEDLASSSDSHAPTEILLPPRRAVGERPPALRRHSPTSTEDNSFSVSGVKNARSGEKWDIAALLGQIAVGALILITVYFKVLPKFTSKSVVDGNPSGPTASPSEPEGYKGAQTTTLPMPGMIFLRLHVRPKTADYSADIFFTEHAGAVSARHLDTGTSRVQVPLNIPLTLQLTATGYRPIKRTFAVQTPWVKGSNEWIQEIKLEPMN